MNIRSTAVFLLGLAAAMTLAGCAAPHQPPRFPDSQSASPAGGTFVNLENLRNVGAGLNKDQVVDLIGPPHFNEWFVGNRVWNYLFAFRRDGKTRACQFQVQFDEHMKVAGTYWREASCADFLRTSPAATVLPDDQAVTIESFSLETDALFAFGKSDLASLLPAGKVELDRVIDRIRQHDAVSEIDVVGHTDRIGSAAYNQQLSRDRADTIRGYMASRGIDAALIRATGVGPDQPVTHCPNGESAAVIACLQPDRRVSVTVKGRH
ncbi:OmpA family protein [Burkholderia sp. A1]|uniref:OmpA family protein n=1 Tax=Burkholderia sp. A1 TaxID=148446 RepID=UPI00046AB1B9|nr:OmpA family protein [Burkholderia sp. A1]